MGPWCSVNFLDSSHWIPALLIAEEIFTFILDVFVIIDGIESLSTVAVTIGVLGWVVALSIASFMMVFVGLGPFLFLQRYPADGGGDEGEDGWKGR